ncbi:ABC transporter permease [Hazenella coriacea]|uniref:ABC-2 type transport system permease protein n=1 Tax=Hazenella coriacea TaxID=1179467 RepID=A0A4R3LDW7_9BACL|nr:ABC transporter permease [Hazenella coriacea]TCS96514.1 ABC-2 type transport system permease protein [Hazenella coriacea]
METNQLFTKRMKSSWSHALQIIVTVLRGGGTLIIAMILFLSISFAYIQLLDLLPTDFPITWVLAILLAFLLTFSQVRTWIQVPDLVFLLPMEAKMKSYFRTSFLYSWVVDAIRLGFLWGFAYPLYMARIGSLLPFLLTYLILVVLLAWNLYMNWLQLRLTSRQNPWSLKGIRLLQWLINAGLVVVILDQRWLFLCVATIVPLIFGWGVRNWTPTFPYPWSDLQKREQRTLARYYSLARLFVDMPNKEEPIKKRTWLIFLFKHSPLKTDPFSYLYWRSFLRRGENFAIYLRLMFWAVIMLLFLPYPWVALLIPPITLWMFATQLAEIASSRRYPIWITLYPVPISKQKEALIQLGQVLLGFQALILSLLLLFFPWVPTLWLWGGWALNGITVFLLSQFLLPYSWKKQSQRNF